MKQTRRTFISMVGISLALPFSVVLSSATAAKAASLFSYGKHFPNGNAAVNYIYGSDGTWKTLTNVQYIWNYYQQYATSNHPYDLTSLVNYANGTHQTTARDANGHLLLDFNHDGEIDVTSGGSSFPLSPR